MPPSFFRIPRELIHETVSLVIRDAPPITLTSFCPSHLTCHMSHAAASSLDARPPFYPMLFMEKFDVSSPRRNLPQDRLGLRCMEEEAKQRYIALQMIRRGEIWSPNLVEALATIYVMLLEDDGRNCERIVWADLHTFVSVFMRERLLEGASDNHGWPVENELNTLVVVLFWLISSQDTLGQETEEFRREIMAYLAPFAFAGFRYPCFTSPEDLFLASENSSKITLNYFGEPTILCLPPIAPFAILSYFARIEYFHLKVPPELPLNRQDATAKGILHGPTQDDIDNFNIRCTTRVAVWRYGDAFDGLSKSRRHDPDWRRSLPSIDSTRSCPPLVYYIPGTLSGRWQGSFIAPYQEDYRSMVCSAQAPSPFPNFGRFPLYVKFRELYCYSPSTPLPDSEDEISFFNAFLPLGCRWHEDKSGIEFVGSNNSFRTHYTPLRRSRDGSGAGIQDVVITGITEGPYATAWNGYKYIGRIRPSDGLIVLLREPLDPQRVDLGRALFRGYVISSRNFVGRWRHVSSAEQPAEWESIFSLCKEVKIL